MSARSRLSTALSLALSLAGCHQRESLEVTRRRSMEAELTREIADLHRMVAKAEAGEIASQERIAIGLSEATSKALLDASLPQEHVLGERLHIRVERAQPFFRGNAAVLVFQASARGEATGAEARLELGGRLANFRIEKGRLSAAVEIVHFKILDTSLGHVGSGVLENLIRGHLDALSGLMPALEIPVQLEESIDIGGLDQGVVVAKSGRLPLQMTLSEVVPMNERLWILLDVKAGPWQKQAAPEKTS